jgi:hypothetical protein
VQNELLDAGRPTEAPPSNVRQPEHPGRPDAAAAAVLSRHDPIHRDRSRSKRSSRRNVVWVMWPMIAMCALVAVAGAVRVEKYKSVLISVADRRGRVLGGLQTLFAFRASMTRPGSPSCPCSELRGQGIVGAENRSKRSRGRRVRDRRDAGHNEAVEFVERDTYPSSGCGKNAARS